MADSLFVRVFTRLERHRGLAIGLLATALVLASLSLIRLKFDNTLDLMLPSDSPAQRMMAFLREANFSNKIVISLEARDTTGDRGRLLEAADALTSSLKSPMITKVTAGFSAPDLMKDAGLFLRHAPQILTPGDLTAIDAGLTEAGVSNVVQRLYFQLLKPEGMFMARAIRSDPLALNQLILGRLEKLSTSMGYDVTMENGHFISRDGRHTLLLIETTVPLTDAAAARLLLGFLRGTFSRLPAGITASLVCGHTHVVSNEDTIMRDLGVVLTLASLAFTVLYVLFFRDVRALLIFLMPALGALVGLAVTALLFPRMSYFVIAFGPVIAGIADDYGIATYVAVRHGWNRAESVRHCVMPITGGAVTTTGIFIAFLFSRIPGYIQLAWFCIVSILVTVALAIFVLPLFLKPGRTKEEVDATPSFVPPAHVGRWVVVIALLFLSAVTLATRVRFDSDITRLDGTDPVILQDEETFKTVWGTGEKKEAMMVIMGDNLEQVREKTDAIYEAAVATVGADQLVSLSSVWPSAKTRAARARGWSAFWRDGREAKFKRLLADQGAARGFSDDAFAPFFERLHEGTAGLADDPGENMVLDNLKDRFIQTPNGRYQTLSFFPDRPEVVTALNGVLKGRADAMIVSRTALSGILSEAFTGEVVRTSLLGALIIVLLAFLFIRRVPLTLIALTPAVAAVAGLLAVMAVIQRPLNVANLISGIVVFGLSIDFGMNILHACQHPQGRHARTAVTFAAITTVLGAAALLFAHHPAMYSIGLTLVIGTGLGYVAAMWMVPVLYALVGRSGKTCGTGSAA